MVYHNKTFDFYLSKIPAYNYNVPAYINTYLNLKEQSIYHQFHIINVWECPISWFNTPPCV